MAPNGETMVSLNPNPSSKNNTNNNNRVLYKPHQALPIEGLQRAISDLSFEMSKDPIINIKEANNKLTTISEVEEAKCECCGMSEECTNGYIHRVRQKYSGRYVCGLCSDVVEVEVEMKEVKREEALKAHMSVCDRFNRIGRTQPLLGQVVAMREILKKCNKEREPSLLIQGRRLMVTRREVSSVLEVSVAFQPSPGRCDNPKHRYMIDHI